MNPTALKDLDESLVLFNRDRYRGELAQALFELMKTQRVTRSMLARLLGVTKGRISHILSGEKNLQADTIADMLLVLGRTPHVVLGVDFDTIRLPVDEVLEMRSLDESGDLTSLSYEEDFSSDENTKGRRQETVGTQEASRGRGFSESSLTGIPTHYGIGAEQGPKTRTRWGSFKARPADIVV